MATTTVTGHGRRSSMRQTELQIPKSSASQSTSSPIDKFPPYEDTIETVAGTTRPNRSASVKYAPNELWEPRKTSFYSREHANGPLRNPKHRPRKSISEAISTIRTRNGSMSANAHELAEALRAPVSYRLTVCGFMNGLAGLDCANTSPRHCVSFGTLPQPSQTRHRSRS